MKEDTIQLTDKSQKIKLYPYTRASEVMVEDGKMLDPILKEMALKIKELEDRLKALEKS